MKSNSKIDIAIIGAGLSGLATAHFLRKSAPNLSITLFEKSDRIGGAIRSHQQDGFLAEAGPHGFLDNCSESLEIIDDLNLEKHIRRASLNNFIRYLCLNSQLFPIPQHPLKVIKSSIMPFWSKVRVLGDFTKRFKPEEQTIADWAEYRFGKAMLPFIDAVITGTFAGDINRLSIDAVFPSFRRLEKEYGSVIKGVIKSKKGKKRSGLPAMTNFEQGMSFFIDKLAEHHTIEKNAGVSSLQKSADDWEIIANDKKYQSTKVIIATDVNQALLLLNQLSPAPLSKVQEAWIANVVLGFKKSDIDIPHGFGYLAPQKEKRFALGAMFSSHMFPERTPKDHAMLEVLVGGRYHPDYLKLDDNEMFDKTLADLKPLIPIRNNPVFKHIIRTKEGFPQLEMGHHKVLTYKQEMESRYNGLFMTGFGWNGIGMNEMMKEAKKIADRLTDQQSSDQKSVKGIYF